MIYVKIIFFWMISICAIAQTIDQYKTTTAAGSVNSYTIPNSDFGAYRTNEKWLIDFTGVTTNSGAATLNRFSLGAKAIKMPDGTDITSAILTGRVQLSYNGTYFYVVGGTGNSGVTNISVTSPLFVTSPTTTPNITIQQATTSQSGYLSNTDWNTFNGKESVLTFSLPLSRSVNTISIPAATGSVNGYLASGDWTTFNNKGSGDALVANPLSQFAATTSAQLRGVLTDELGTGAALFDGATPTSFVGTNITGTASGLTAGNVPLSGVTGLGVNWPTALGASLGSGWTSALNATYSSSLTNPMTTAGDLIVGGSSGTPARLGIGSARKQLRVNTAGTAIEYAFINDVYNVKDYGALGDAVTTSANGSISSGANILTVSTNTFTAGDVGKVIVIIGAGAAGANLTTTISGFTSTHVVTITANASTTVTTALVTYGTDDTTALTNTLAAIPTQGGVLYLPASNYIVTSQIVVNKNVIIRGDGDAPFNLYTSTTGVTGTPGATNIICTSTTIDNFLFTNTGTNAFPVIKVQDITFININQANVTNGSAIKIVNELQNLKFVHCNFTGFYDNVYVQSATFYLFDNCKFINPKHSGLVLGNNGVADVGNSNISNCSFVASQDNSRDPFSGIYFRGGGAVIIDNCTFNSGLNYTPASTNTTVHQNFQYAIYGDNADGCTGDIQITNCAIENYRESAIVWNNGCGTNVVHVQILNVEISPISIATTQKEAIVLVNTSYSTIQNVIMNNFALQSMAFAGIRLTGTDHICISDPVLISSDWNLGLVALTSTNTFTTYPMNNGAGIGEVSRAQNLGTSIYVRNTDGGSVANATTRVLNTTSNTSSYGEIAILGTGFTTSGLRKANTVWFEGNTSNDVNLSNFAAHDVVISTNARLERLRITSAGTILTNGTGNALFRQTNAGGDFTAHFMIDPANSASTAGSLSYFWENASGAMMFGQANGTRRILGAAIKPTDLTNTANSEAMGLGFMVQSAGAVVSTKVNISSLGRTFFGGSTIATALVQIGAGTATASTAPEKYTAGTLLTTIEAFAKEANANGFYSSSNALNRYAEGGVITDFISDVNNTSTTETDLYTYTTKASTLVATGEKIKAEFSGTFNDATATTQIQVYFAGTNIFNSTALTLTGTGAWHVDVTIIRTGSSTARAIVRFTADNTTVGSPATETDLTSLTFTNTNILKCTGTAGGAGGGSSDITAKLGNIFWYGAANN